MKKLLLPFCFLLVLFNSCSTDFQTLASYKEIMVVYGFVNPNDSIQFIRVSKAYLGEGNALIMAQQSDSINYADILEVKMERIVNGSVANTYPLLRVDTIHRDAGTFNQATVYFADTNKVFADGSTYKITIHNKSTGLTATSTTYVVQNPNVDSPFGLTLNFTPVSTGSSKIQFYSGNKAYLYETKFRFHYTEKDTITGITIEKYFDWDFGQKLAPPSLSTAIQYPYTYSTFYNILAENVAIDQNKYRSLLPAELIITAITEDLNTYVGLTSPATGVVQDRPLYTNIENGIGIFTSRNVYSRKYNVSYNTLQAIDTSLHFR